LALLEVLQDRGIVSADELAGRLDVDARSVRRHVTVLRELGVPVESVRGRYGGYRLAQGARVPPLLWRDDEAVAIAVALGAAAHTDHPTEPTALDRALVKLRRVLPTPLQMRVDTVAAAVGSFGGRGDDALPDPEVVLVLSAAARDHHRVRIDHTRRQGEPTTRVVDPYGLVVHARRWYLVGHDHMRDGVRTFRVDRISRATALSRRFRRPDDVDAVAHVRQTLTLDAWTHRTEVWLDTDVETARRRLPDTFGTLQPCPEGGVLLVSGVEDLTGMALALSGLPWRFTVRSPAALIDALDDHVASLAGAVVRSRR
jgi:predicted DNA-binding transcriptional regulator YafY